MPPLEKLLTMQEAADALSITRKTLLAHIRQGRIAYVAVGNGGEREARRFRPSDIERFTQAQRRVCQPPAATGGKPRAKVSTGSGQFDMRALLEERRGIRGLLDRQERERRKRSSD